jgi:aryl-alcohol dehydrogenase-like predicted oxidoreductase
MERASATGAGIIVRGGIARGGPDAVIQRPDVNAVWNEAGLNEFLTDDMTPAQLILRCTLSNPNVDTVIVGTCNLEHLEENVAAFNAGPLPEDVLAAIRERIALTIADHSRRS